jgi:predicted metal-binding membrane protein
MISHVPNGDAASATGRSIVSSLRHFTSWHPEWWTLVLCLGCWIALTLQSDHETLAAIYCGPLHDFGASAGAASSARAAGIAGWIIMVGAMMLPRVIEPVRRTAFASLWRRRHRAVAGFLLGYCAIWIAAGFFGLAVFAGLDIGAPAKSGAAALAFALAGLWELTPLKRRALSGCHRTMPLRPLSWRADLDCLRYGAIHGCNCLGSCWAIMLGSVLASHRLPIMASAALICAAERYRPRRTQAIEAAALMCLALGYALASLA